MKVIKVEIQGFIWDNAATLIEDLPELDQCPFCDELSAIGPAESENGGLFVIACGACGGIGPDSSEGYYTAAEWWNGGLK